jgi:polysaccharide pyruvyl transferase WcaK-like protein
MDQDYNYMPLLIEEFDDYAQLVKEGSTLMMEKRAIDNCDKVVINVEGGLTHHTNASRCEGKYRARTRYVLFLAYYAKKFCGKEVSVINHCVDPGNSTAEEMIKKIYPLIDRCWVRDHLSKKNLENLGINFAKHVPDALFNFQYLENSPKEREYICISETATLGYANWDFINFYESLIKKLQKLGQKIIFIDGNMWKATEALQSMCSKLNVQWVHVDNTSYKDLAKLLRRSKVFFSGRWHASILATICGTPSVLFGTDSHKTKALHEELNYKGRFYEVDDLPSYIEEIIDRLINVKNIETELVNYSQMQREKLNKFYSTL